MGTWRAPGEGGQGVGAEKPIWSPVLIVGDLLSRAWGRGQGLALAACPGVQAGGAGDALCASLRGLSPHQPWPSSSNPLELPPGPLGSHRGWDTELQGMGLSQRVRAKQGWWLGGDGSGDSPLTAPSCSLLKRRKTSNSAWSPAAHPCPSSCSHQGQGQLRVSAPTLVWS